ncbi:hypothetical protein JCM18237_15750 [Halorubrum luteum]
MSDQRSTAYDESTGPVEPTSRRPADRETWASLYTLLAEGLKHPDERLHRDVKTGRFAAELTDLAETLSVPVPDGPGTPDAVPAGRAAFDNEYVALFEGLRVPYAPLIESVYRPWYDTAASEGLRSGPPAADMQDRYDAAGIAVPPAYPPDHLALLLEYAAVLLRAGERKGYLRFLDRHLGWLPALRRMAHEAAANAPFHSYCVDAVCETVAAARGREGIAPPRSDVVEEMIDRVERRVE